MGWSLRLGPREYLIASDLFVVGRGKGVHLPLPDESVSRRHAVLRVHGDQAVLEDLHSRNGTFVNGQAVVGATRLSPGDRIALGSRELVVVRTRDASFAEDEPETRPLPRLPLDPHVGADSLAALSPREREIFALIAEGLSQRAIADHFRVSIKTVETYRTRIGQKLGLRSRAELIRCALDAGVLRASANN